VYHAAAGVNANAVKLLDSRAFMTKLATIDPTDHVAIAAAIGDAVTADPSLAQAASDTTTSRLPAPNPAQGSSASGAVPAPTQLTRQDVSTKRSRRRASMAV
jgi:hypothetical protein